MENPSDGFQEKQKHVRTCGKETSLAIGNIMRKIIYCFKISDNLKKVSIEKFTLHKNCDKIYN